MSITAVVENDSIKLPPGVHVPDGTKVEITVPESAAAESKSSGTPSWMMKHAGLIEGPEDSTVENDHPIHGTPKRTDSGNDSHLPDAAEQQIERAAWLAQSERRLREVWDNDADDVYNELLAR